MSSWGSKKSKNSKFTSFTKKPRFRYEPSMWSSGLGTYHDAHCNQAVQEQFSRSLAGQYDESRDFQIRLKARKCMNNKFMADFDADFAEHCMPDYITNNLVWIPTLSLIGKFGTFVFLIHKVIYEV